MRMEVVTMKDGGGAAWGGVAQDSWSREGRGAPVHSVRQASAVETEAAAHGGQKDNSNVYESTETGVPEAPAANPGPVGLPVRSTNPLGLLDNQPTKQWVCS